MEGDGDILEILDLPSEPLLSPPYSCSPSGLEVLHLVNSYREAEGLERVAASSSLCAVANEKIRQLVEGGVEGHDWRDCSFTEEPACMWDKPQLLTGYPGFGYENYAGHL